MISCSICKEMAEKIHFFHEKFQGREWSGPAWFQHVLDEHGYPTHLELVHFEVIDISTAGETEWNQTAFMSVFPKVLAMFQERGIDPTTLLSGNIHSHHQMRAFFSGVDTGAMNEHAPDEGFWISIIVSTSGDESKTINNKTLSMPTNRCGAISYKGKFNRPVIDYNMDVFDLLHNFDDDSFKDEIDNANKQNRMRKVVTKKEKKGTGYGRTYSPLDRLNKKQQEEVLAIATKIVGGNTQKEIEEQVEKLFDYFDYYYGVECVLEDLCGFDTDDLKAIKKSMNWDFGQIKKDKGTLVPFNSNQQCLRYD